MNFLAIIYQCHSCNDFWNSLQARLGYPNIINWIDKKSHYWMHINVIVSFDPGLDLINNNKYEGVGVSILGLSPNVLSVQRFELTRARTWISTPSIDLQHGALTAWTTSSHVFINLSMAAMWCNPTALQSGPRTWALRQCRRLVLTRSVTVVI